MNGMRWRLERLRAMDPAEVAQRAGRMLRDRLAPPAYTRWAPAEAFARRYAGDVRAVLAGSRLGALVRGALDPAACPGTLEAARALDDGRWSLFGHAVRLADPPEWSANPLTGERWPEAPSRAIDHRDPRAAGGAKFAWELERLTMLPTLALASRVTGELRHATRARRWLADFSARAPLGVGIAHTSGIEQAVRVMTAAMTLALLPEDDAGPPLEPVLGLMAQQALACRDHLSLGSSANNHLIAEYAAMTTMGAAFPGLRDGAALLAQGHDGLVHETLRQFHPDGVPGEQAFGYLPFVWELLLMPFTLAEAAGRATPPAVRERLGASLEFARWIRLPDGSAPRVGDEDDGRILLADEHATRLDLVGAALAAWLGAEAPSDAAPALARLMTGRAPAVRTTSHGSRSFDAGGYTVWRAGELIVTFDHGPLGLGRIAAHGHADALAITLQRGADGLIVDPGTFAYQEDAVLRDRCRSTPAHATVNFGGRSQSEMLGPFLWGRRANVTREGPGWRCAWAGGERHTREVLVTDDTVTLLDRVDGRSPMLAFPLAPGVDVRVDGRRVTLVSGGSRAEMRAEGAGAWRIEPGLFAPRFSQREPAPWLVAPIEARECRTVIEIGPR